MTAAEMEAIIGGYHGDAFSVLGPHPINKDKPRAEWTIRAFLPHAKSAAVLLDGAALPMQKLHPAGFYAVELSEKPGAYRLEIENWHGGKSVMEDAYRFPPVMTEFDLHLHGEGTLHEAWHSYGAHLATIDGVDGVRFAVWAPNALNVSLTGSFNDWDGRRNPMRLRNAGVWEIFMPGARDGDAYKYFVRSKNFGHQQLKADPYAFRTEVPPKSASIVSNLDS
jgi:1,4-alpha-glucan branching enzyme